jgi:hypothetical protein
MPARLRDIISAAAALGCTCEEPSSGSHWKIYRGSMMYPIPAHNGQKTEIGDYYIRGLCRSLRIDEKELRRRL